MESSGFGRGFWQTRFPELLRVSFCNMDVNVAVMDSEMRWSSSLGILRRPTMRVLAGSEVPWHVMDNRTRPTRDNCSVADIIDSTRMLATVSACHHCATSSPVANLFGTTHYPAIVCITLFAALCAVSYSFEEAQLQLLVTATAAANRDNHNCITVLTQ